MDSGITKMSKNSVSRRKGKNSFLFIILNEVRIFLWISFNGESFDSFFKKNPIWIQVNDFFQFIGISFLRSISFPEWKKNKIFSIHFCWNRPFYDAHIENAKKKTQLV